MKRILLILCSFLFILTSSTTFALTIDATVTADNHYGLYFGSGDGSSITFVGRNETATGGSAGTYNWSVAEIYNFNANEGDYIYIAAWSDDSVAQGWIGQFLTGTSSILSNTSEWEVALTFQDLGTNSPAPTEASLGSEIATAIWNPVTNSIDHGSSPWGWVAGISSDADWIWGSSLTPGSNYGEYQIFRTQVNAPVPEPATMMLFGIGLLGLAGVSRRKK
ncbi:MAG: PEP-CTERM sorting domain-containing protein [Proteobacteria bacterium]|nr:PEP-CTERM sorting domain-containing protein [Pseudomonadota bacterium]MBU1389236.1 PEP-CTERM sorting domain-containing protein [Pseudomonadota bacterium]MBU1544800.1 PEP-CTERM sorting domain-containing protein [Pseudomonadota bacterium]